MAEYEVSPTEIGAVLRADDEHRREALKTAILEAAHAGLTVLVPSAPKDMGHLGQSGHVEEHADGVEIVFDAPHAGIVEAGSRPHMPPFGPIYQWVLRHLGQFGVEKVGSFRRVKGGAEKSNAAFAQHLERVDDMETEARGIAEAIRWKIYQHGSAPTWFVRSKLPVLKAILGRMIDKHLSGR